MGKRWWLLRACFVREFLCFFIRDIDWRQELVSLLTGLLILSIWIAIRKQPVNVIFKRDLLLNLQIGLPCRLLNLKSLFWNRRSFLLLGHFGDEHQLLVGSEGESIWQIWHSILILLSLTLRLHSLHLQLLLSLRLSQLLLLLQFLKSQLKFIRHNSCLLAIARNTNWVIATPGQLLLQNLVRTRTLACRVLVSDFGVDRVMSAQVGSPQMQAGDHACFARLTAYRFSLWGYQLLDCGFRRVKVLQLLEILLDIDFLDPKFLVQEPVDFLELIPGILRQGRLVKHTRVLKYIRIRRYWLHIQLKCLLEVAVEVIIAVVIIELLLPNQFILLLAFLFII